MTEYRRTVTCHTDGCLNAGVPIDVTWDDYGDPDAPQPSIVCGPCGQPIEDVATS